MPSANVPELHVVAQGWVGLGWVLGVCVCVWGEGGEGGGNY